MKIALSRLETIKRHARDVFPEECCGLLIGRVQRLANGQIENIVYEVAPCTNRLGGDRTLGFEIAAYQCWNIDFEAKKYGLEIVGTYHSHTSAPAFPSDDDCNFTKVDQSMLIISLTETKIAEIRSWSKDESLQTSEDKIKLITVSKSS